MEIALPIEEAKPLIDEEKFIQSFLERSGLSRDQISFEEQEYPGNQSYFLYTLRGPAGESIHTDKFVFTELKDRTDVLSARLVKPQEDERTLYLDRAATLPRYRKYGASTVLLAHVLSKHPYDKIIVPHIAGTNMQAFNQSGVAGMPISRSLQQLGFSLPADLDYAFGEPMLIATRSNNSISADRK